jgi:hypothetical protein
LRTTGFDHWSDLFVLLVVEDDDGSDEAGRLGTAGILTVTGGAVLFVKRLAFLGLGGIGSRSKPKEFTRAGAAPASTHPAASASTTRSRRPPRVLLSERKRRERQ